VTGQGPRGNQKPEVLPTSTDEGIGGGCSSGRRGKKEERPKNLIGPKGACSSGRDGGGTSKKSSVQATKSRGGGGKI